MPKQLFLASSVDKTLHKLKGLVGIDPTKTQVGIIEDAAIPYGTPEELFWIKNDWDAFLKEGYNLNKISLSENINNLKFLQSEIEKCQILHVCGGNTLFLNYLFKQSGLDKVVVDFVNSGMLIYTGTSAGSMIVSPDLHEIKNSLYEEIEMKYLEGIQRKDYFGLNLVPFLIIPHFNNPDFLPGNYKTIQKTNYPYPLFFLNDNQAIWVEGEKFEIVEK